MTLTTATLKIKYSYIFAKARERGLGHTNHPVIEATVAFHDKAPADALERLDFDPDAPGLNIEERTRAVTEEAAGNAFCVFHKDGHLTRVWWRIGIARNTPAFDQLQLWAEQARAQAALASTRV